MTLDDRLREGIHLPEDAHAPDLELALEQSREAGRRRKRKRRGAATAAALASLASLAIGAAALPIDSRSERHVTTAPDGGHPRVEWSPSTTWVAPTTTASKTPRRPGPARPDNTGDFVNGHQYVYITELDLGRREMTVDGALWFTGEESEVARAEDGERDFPDYYVRNGNARLRTLRLADACEVGLVDGEPDPSQPPWEGDSMVHRATLEDLAEDLSNPWRTDKENGRHHLGFWIDIRDGEIVRIEEQYTP